MKEEKTYTYLVWQYKDYEPIGVLIDKFIETQIELCLLGMGGKEKKQMTDRMVTKKAQCLVCGNIWKAMFPYGTNTSTLECPICHNQRSRILTRGGVTIWLNT